MDNFTIYGLTGLFFVLVIAVGLFMTRRKKTKITTIKKDLTVRLPECFSVSPSGHLLINGKSLETSKQRFYIQAMERVYANRAGHVFVELLEDDCLMSLVEFDHTGHPVGKHQLPEGISAIKSYYQDSEGRLNITISVAE